MRRATWEQLNRQILVRTIGRVYQALGLKLTQRKLAQTVPVVGIGIDAALSASMTRHVYQRAEDAYRGRFLPERYGLDASDWLITDGDGTACSSGPCFNLTDTIAQMRLRSDHHTRRPSYSPRPFAVTTRMPSAAHQCSPNPASAPDRPPSPWLVTAGSCCRKPEHPIR